jgi:hypothetical protein
LNYIGSARLATHAEGVQINGTLAASVDVEAASTLSDKRLKTDITPIVDGLSIILKLHPVFYTALAEAYKGERHPGLIANDVQKIIPAAVWERKIDKYLGLRDERITPFLIRAIQELDERVKKLEEQLKKYTDE